MVEEEEEEEGKLKTTLWKYLKNQVYFLHGRKQSHITIVIL